MGRSSRRGSLTYYRDDLALVHHLGFHGVQARVCASFGDEVLPNGLVAIVGRKADG